MYKTILGRRETEMVRFNVLIGLIQLRLWRFPDRSFSGTDKGSIKMVTRERSLFVNVNSTVDL